MKLVDSVPWYSEIIDAPPVRLDYQNAAIPNDVEHTYIGIRHDIDGGEPDYISAALSGTDVLFLEQSGWTPELLKRLQRVADGDYNAYQRTLQQVAWQKQHTPGSSAYAEIVYKQLYGSKVKVAMPDYPARHPLDKAFRRLALQGIELDKPTYLERDKLILQSIAKEIPKLRAERKLQYKSPLRVVSLIGATHVAEHDALAEAAHDQGIHTYSSKLLFEEGASMVTSTVASDDIVYRTIKSMVDYQNWLRTPADESEEIVND